MLKILSALRVFSSQQVRIWELFVALGGVLLFSGMAQAHITPVLTAGPAIAQVTPGQYQYTYTYRLDVSSDERLDPAATQFNCPGLNATKVPCFPAGTFVTIYDIPGLITADVPANSGFSVSTAVNGLTPSSITSIIDNPNLANVTFIYTGPVTNGPISITGFTIVTSFGGINNAGVYSDQATINAVSGLTSMHPENIYSVNAVGDTDQSSGTVAIPSSVTAASVTVGGRVMTSIGRGIRNITVTMTDSLGNERKTTTTSFGYYRFEDVPAGETYILTARAKRYTFAQASQVLNITQDTEGINFIGSTSMW